MFACDKGGSKYKDTDSGTQSRSKNVDAHLKSGRLRLKMGLVSSLM